MSTPLLPIDAVDLASLILARNDSHPAGDWWYDPRTGRSLYYGVDDDTDLPELVEGVHVLVPHDPQPRDDVEEFFELAEELGVPEDALVRLWDAFRRKGGLRRFRELVGRTPAADVWSDLTYRREAVRAIDWLLERGLVEPSSARARRDELASVLGPGAVG